MPIIIGTSNHRHTPRNEGFLDPDVNPVWCVDTADCPGRFINTHLFMDEAEARDFYSNAKHQYHELYVCENMPEVRRRHEGTYFFACSTASNYPAITGISEVHAPSAEKAKSIFLDAHPDIEAILSRSACAEITREVL